MLNNSRLSYASSTRLHPLPRMKKAWIPLHNAQVRLCAECLQVVKSAPTSVQSGKTKAFLLPALNQMLFQANINPSVLVYVKHEKRHKNSSALAPGLLKLVSYSKWESLNRAPMNITTSLDLKSPGIFVGIACALQEETPPCRLYCCFTHSTARSMCPHALSLPSYIMLLCVFFCFLWTRLLEWPWMRLH